MEGAGASAITVYGVSAYTSGGAPFVLYGNDDAGNDFCCSFWETGSEIARVRVWGDPDTPDTLWLQSADGSYYIQDPGGVQTLFLEVKGNGGPDDIRGTKSAQALIDEQLRGNEGDDTISVYRESTVYGDEDKDTIYGSAYADTLYGDAPCGGLEGIEDDDQVFASGGDDLVRTCAGRDLVCAGGGDDTVTGDADGDILWGGSSYGESNTIDGGGSPVDKCGAGTLSNCEDVIGMPDEC